jgi:hypothetical protein
MVPAEAYPSPQSPYQNSGLERSLGVGSSLHDAAKAHLFSREMTAIIFDVVSILETTGRTELLLATAASEGQWISKKKTQALLGRLLSLSAHGQEKCVRRTLLVILNCMSMSATWRSGKVKMSNLADRLQHSVAQCTEGVHGSDVRI